MVQLLPDLERNLVRRGFKILPSFIVMNFVEREWSMCSVNWISRGPEAWAQMRSTSTGWRSSTVKDTKHRPWGRKCWKSCKWGETSGACMHWRLRTSLQHLLTLWTEILASILLFHNPLTCKANQTNKKKLLYWRCNNNLQFALCKWRTCQRRVESFSWELCQKKTSGYIENKRFQHFFFGNINSLNFFFT